MKKHMSILLVVAMLMSLLVGCESTTEEKKEEVEEKVKVGITIQSLENEYWESVMGKLSDIMADAGWEYEIVACEDNAATQISQIQEFMETECDLIMVHPSDAASVEKVCGEAVMEGVKVMCWDDPMENTTVNWVLDNTELGMEIGKTAAEFINSYYTEKSPAKVVVIGYPSTNVLLERANGIMAGLKENCLEGVYEVVSEVEGLEADQAFENCEMALSFNPDATVFVGVGAGAMLGANRALLEQYGGEGTIPEHVGVIGTDVTIEQLESLQAGDEAIRAIVGFEGSNLDTAEACFDIFERILDGEEFTIDTKNIKRPVQLISQDDIETIMEGM